MFIISNNAFVFVISPELNVDQTTTTTTDPSVDVFTTIGQLAFDFSSLSATLYGSRDKAIGTLSQIERLLAFALTHCESTRIASILADKRSVERARLRLTKFQLDDDTDYGSGGGGDDDADASELCFDLIAWSTGRLFRYESMLLDADPITRLLKASDVIVRDRHSLISLLRTLSRMDANLAMGYLLEMDEHEVRTLLSNETMRCDSALGYEFHLYFLALNVINKCYALAAPTTQDVEQRHFYYSLRPSTLNIFITKTDTLK